VTVEMCSLCEQDPATTSYGFPVCAACRAFLERLDVDLKAMEAADPELARIANRSSKPYRERAREAIAARRKETPSP
jgi:hypothetical protein